MKALPIHLLACLFLLPIMASPVYAQDGAPDAIGKFINAIGNVYIIKNDGNTTPASIDAPVFLNDLIKTEDDARAMILFKDETELVLGSNADLTVDDFFFTPEDTTKNKGNFVLKGPFLWMSGLLAKENKNVTLNTNMGSLGIRGTEVWGGTLDDKFGVFVLDGQVIFQSATGRVSIETGEGVFLDDQNSTLTVKKWGAPKIEAAVDTIALPEEANLTQKYKDALLDDSTETGPEDQTDDTTVPPNEAPLENETPVEMDMKIEMETETPAETENNEN